MRIEPFLCLGDVEVGNLLRTASYLQQGLGGGGFTVADACWCQEYDDGPYVGPEADDAPWFTTGHRASSEFLGFIPHNATMHPTLGRSVSHGLLGATLGPQAAGGYIVAVEGTMYAGSRQGMAYGERWLTEVLAGSLCGDDPSLRVLLACPPLGESQTMWRTLPHVGLVDGPVFSRRNTVPECILQSVTFQIASESPWLLADATVVADEIALDNLYETYHLLTTPSWVGGAALRITVDVGQGAAMTNLFIQATPTTPGAPGVCPSVGGSCWSFSVPYIPAGHTLTVDAVDRVAEIRNPATGAVLHGLDAFDWDGLGFPWPELGPCAEVCLFFDVDQVPFGSTYSIEQVATEL